MGARISWRDAMGLSGTVDLSFGDIFVGRAMECAIRTDDPMVSRRHAKIVFDRQNGRHVIEDLGSANGILFNDQRVPSHAFTNGDLVRAGNLQLAYASDGMMTFPGAPAPAPAAVASPFGGTAMMTPGQNLGGPPPAAAPGGFAGALGGVPQAPMPGMSEPPRGATPRGFEKGATPAEFEKLQRRFEQLQAEIKLLRGGGLKAVTMEQLEQKVAYLEKDKADLEARIPKLEEAARGVQLTSAALALNRAEEVVNGLNDVLSEMRINMMAAEGEIGAWEKVLPRGSFELVRDAILISKAQMEQAAQLMRRLRNEAAGSPPR